MPPSAEQGEALVPLFRDGKIGRIVETGTFDGSGSTTNLAKLVAEHAGRAVPFVTIEACWSHWRRARRNLKPFPFVRSLWGLSVPKDDALRFIAGDEALRNHSDYPDLYIDDVDDPVGFYTREINGHLSRSSIFETPFRLWDERRSYEGEALLRREILRDPETVPLIVLDSAGGIGLLEFRIVEESMRARDYYLLLDDIDHLKHFRSCELISSTPAFSQLASNVQEGWALSFHNAES